MSVLLLIATLLSMPAKANATASPFSYVALGDSLSAGQGARRGYVDCLYDDVLRDIPGAVLHNLSSSGATTSDVLRSQLPRVARLRPSLVTLTIGTNDVTEGTKIDEVVRNLATVIKSVRALGAAVVVTNLPAVALAPAVPATYRAQLDGLVRSANAALQAVCDANGAAVFDLYALSRDEIPRHPEYFSFDGYHPSDDGYDRWARSMWPVVKRALLRR